MKTGVREMMVDPICIIGITISKTRSLSIPFAPEALSRQE